MSNLIVNIDHDGLGTDGIDNVEDHCAIYCSLHEAIKESNARPGKDIIKFNFPSSMLTISSVSPLDAIMDPVIIDGSTQSGYSGKPVVELTSNPDNEDYGLLIRSGDTVVKGLAINGFKTGILIEGKEDPPIKINPTTTTVTIKPTGGNVIEGNFIGTNLDGVSASKGNFYEGIAIVGSSNNKIGGITPEERNVISGNIHNGIRTFRGIKSYDIIFDDPNTSTFRQVNHLCDEDCAPSRNLIEGNYIGVDFTGKNKLANGDNGVLLVESNNNILGGNEPEKYYLWQRTKRSLYYWQHFHR